MSESRYAIIRNARSRSEVEAYLPDNYHVLAEVKAWWYDHNSSPIDVFVIQGEDAAGWTLDGYVIPRYASGLIQAEEIDLSHPIMREIPALTCSSSGGSTFSRVRKWDYAEAMVQAEDDEARDDVWYCPGCWAAVEPSDVRRHVAECPHVDGAGQPLKR